MMLKNVDELLIDAVMKGYYKEVEGLLNKGADPNLQNRDGRTAHQIALDKGHEPLINVFEPYLSLSVSDREKLKKSLPNLIKRSNQQSSSDRGVGDIAQSSTSESQPALSLVLYLLAALSVLGSVVLAFDKDMIFIPRSYWLAAGIVEAVIFIFMGRVLFYLNKISLK